MSETAAEVTPVEAELHARGVQGVALTHLLNNGVGNRVRLRDADWLLAANGWREKAESMDFGALEERERRMTLNVNLPVLERPMRHGTEFETALRLIFGFSCLPFIAGSHGPFSILGPVAKFDDELEGQRIARIWKVTPKLKAILFVEDGQPGYWATDGEHRVRRPALSLATNAEEFRRLKQQLDVQLSLRSVLEKAADAVQGMALASVLIAAGCEHLGNSRLAGLRLERISSPDRVDVAVWCRAYADIVDMRGELGV